MYSKSSNSVQFCPNNTSRYSKPRYLNLYYDLGQNLRNNEELRYFTCNIEYFRTKNLIAL